MSKAPFTWHFGLLCEDIRREMGQGAKARRVLTDPCPTRSPASLS